MNPTESKFSVQWDEQMCRMGPTEARKMFARACKEALTIPEQQVTSLSHTHTHTHTHTH